MTWWEEPEALAALNCAQFMRFFVWTSDQHHTGATTEHGARQAQREKDVTRALLRGA